MTFLSVWLEPQVDVEVRITATGVRMRSTAARLRGSDFVARSGLNESVDLAWRTVLTWGGGGDGGNGGGGGGGGHIRVRTSVAVWAEVLPPFHLVPRAVLTAACAAVLRRAVPALLDAFARSLADDYRRWASEPAYRRQRAEAAEAAAGRAGGAAAAMGGEVTSRGAE